MSEELPEGWAETTLGELFEFKYGKGLPAENRNSSGRVPVYGSNGIVGAHSSPLSSGPTIVIGRKGSVGAVQLSEQACWPIDTTYYIDDLPDDFPAIYWARYLKSLRLGQQEKSSAIPGISRVDITGLEAPVPPLAEQHRIVAKLEALLSKVDSCQQRLAKIPAILKRFRRSVLAAACSGRLTVEWRRAHPMMCTPETTAGTGHNAVLDFEQETFAESSQTPLPETWKWIPLGALGDLRGGGTPAKDNPSYWNGTIPWVSAKDMKRDRIGDSADHITRLAVRESAVKMIPEGAILFVVRGMILNHTLPTALTERMVTINQDMKALVPAMPEMSEYLFLTSKHIAQQILFAVKEATHGTRRIETKTLRSWAVPVPPIDEQAEIVRRARALSEVADKIETRFRETREQLENGRPAILSKAFRGELVPTEAELAALENRTYESAEALLRRIREVSQTAPNMFMNNIRRPSFGARYAMLLRTTN